MAYLPGSSNGTTGVSLATGAIKFNNLVQSEGGVFSLNTATGLITISSTGYYHIAWGLIFLSGAGVVTSLSVQVNGVSPSPSNQIMEINNPGSGYVIYYLETIIQLGKNPSTVSVILTGSTLANVNNATNSTSGMPVAYITLTGLQ
jgi:hypothetical protein